MACLAVIASDKFMQKNSITGFAAAEAFSEEKQANATRAEALDAIEQAKKDMQEMKDAGFGAAYINDTILSAERAFERADYMESLQKKKNLTEEMIAKARQVFEEGITEGATYSDVIRYTAEVSERKAGAYMIHDALRVAKTKAEEYAKAGVETGRAQEIIGEAESRFSDEMYEDAEKLAGEADALLEKGKAELTLVSAMAKAGKSFFENNWKGIIIISAIILALGTFTALKIRKAIAKKKLETLKTEKEVIVKLMKDAQIKRFKEGKLSASSYNIRMNKYKERLTEISHTIPVLESRTAGGKQKHTKR